MTRVCQERQFSSIDNRRINIMNFNAHEIVIASHVASRRVCECGLLKWMDEVCREWSRMQSYKFCQQKDYKLNCGLWHMLLAEIYVEIVNKYDKY